MKIKYITIAATVLVIILAAVVGTQFLGGENSEIEKTFKYYESALGGNASGMKKIDVEMTNDDAEAITYLAIADENLLDFATKATKKASIEVDSVEEVEGGSTYKVSYTITQYDINSVYEDVFINNVEDYLSEEELKDMNDPDIYKDEEKYNAIYNKLMDEYVKQAEKVEPTTASYETEMVIEDGVAKFTEDDMLLVFARQVFNR